MALPAYRLWSSSFDVVCRGSPTCNGPDCLVRSIEMATTYDSHNSDGDITQLNRAQCNIVEHAYEDACKAIGSSNPTTAALKKYFKVALSCRSSDFPGRFREMTRGVQPAGRHCEAGRSFNEVSACCVLSARGVSVAAV